MNQRDEKSTLDCLMISPSNFHDENENIWKEINSNFPSLGLISIAGYVRAKGHSVKIIDCNIESPSVQQFRSYFAPNYAEKYSGIRYIGLTAMTCNIKKAYKIAEICREYYPEAFIVFGGVHATLMPDEVIRQPFVDAVAIGEGELTMEEILAGRDLAAIDGIVYKERKGGRMDIKYTAPRRRILDLNSLPMPAYDLLPVLKYKPTKGSYKRLPAMAMMTSRGCPGKCTFCSRILGNVLVFKSAETILREVRYLADNYGIRQILFYDDTFTVFKDNVIRLCDLLLAHKIDITWTCFARVDYIDPEMLSRMKRAGCHQIMYGVENIDEGILRNINKKINLGQVENAVKWTKQAGIECRLAFMVGNPGDSREIVKKNIAAAIRLDPDYLIVNITTPFPGTEMFKWAEERGLILTHDWDDYTFAKPIMKLENMSAGEIRGLYKYMYRSFYFRPGFILKKLLRARSAEDLKILLGGFGSLFNFFVKKQGH